MVRPKQKTSQKQDVSLVLPLLRVNIHGVRMHGPSSTSIKRPKTSSTRRSREGSADHLQAPMNSTDSLEVLEVNPLAMVLWVDHRVLLPLPCLSY